VDIATIWADGAKFTERTKLDRMSGHRRRDPEFALLETACDPNQFGLGECVVMPDAFGQPFGRRCEYLSPSPPVGSDLGNAWSIESGWCHPSDAIG
jgi:hypothetical protein